MCWDTKINPSFCLPSENSKGKPRGDTERKPSKQGGCPMALSILHNPASPRSHRHTFPFLAFVFQFVDMMGWRLETGDRAEIPVSFNPGSSSVVADLQELPSTVHSATWVAPPSYLGDKVMISCCSSRPSPGLLPHCMSVIYWVSGREHQEVQVTKMEEIRLTPNAGEMLPPSGRG